MNSARDLILRTLRGAHPRQEHVVEDRLQRPPLLPITPPVDLLAALKDKFASHGISIETLNGPAEIIPFVLSYVARFQLSLPLHAAHRLVENYPDLGAWPNGAVVFTAAPKSCNLSLTVASFGLAESGSLIMLSGSDSPTTLNFVPDHHLVVLKATDVYFRLEDVWPLISQPSQPIRQLPRTINCITGPSRTADIEQTIVLGAHGPLRLTVLLLP